MPLTYLNQVWTIIRQDHTRYLLQDSAGDRYIVNKARVSGGVK